MEAGLTPGTYAEVRRRWKAGDVAELDLHFKPELWQANPLVEDVLGQVAVKCGPIVYCAESNDLPAGVRLEDVALPVVSGLRSFRRDTETIAGARVTALATSAVALRRPAWKGGELYRDADAVGAEPIELKFIPYYAWDNRGDTEMTVWLPLR